MVNGRPLIRRCPPAGLRADQKGWSEYCLQEGRLFYSFQTTAVIMSHSVMHVGVLLCGTYQPDYHVDLYLCVYPPTAQNQDRRDIVLLSVSHIYNFS